MPRQNHRARLIRGAIRCLREKGYSRTTARDIAAASGANLGSIGYHFGSKDALLNEALAQAFREWTEQVAREVLETGDAAALERLRVSWRAVLDAYEDQRGLLMAFLEALPAAARDAQLRDQLAGQYREAREAIATLIRASAPGAADGGAAPAATILASLLIATYDGLLVQWLLEPASTPSGDEIADALERVLDAGGAGS